MSSFMKTTCPFIKTTLLLLLLLIPASLRAEIVIIVSQDNPLQQLTNAQVVRIFLRKHIVLPGEISLEPVDQPKGSLRDRFYETYTGMNRARISAYWAQRVFTGAGQPPLQVIAEEDVAPLIAGSPNRIGYADSATLNAQVRALTILP